jgi:DNA invertase Pin-like site-specific DNA recombinase
MNRDYIPPPSGLPSGSTVWAYLRDSGGASQELSVSQQRGEVEDYCQRFHLALLHTFADEAKTGTTDVGREAFADMIDMAANPDLRTDGILFWNFARSGRNLDDTIYYKAMLRKYGLIVHSMTDPIPEGEYGRVVEVIIDISNQERARQTSRDVRRALQALARQGYAVGGLPPRGYLAEKVTIGHKRDGRPRVVSRWVEDPELWELCKLAWALRAEGKTYSEIRKATGGHIYESKNCWLTFFSNKTYLGIGKCGELEIPDHHPAMIDAATWEAVQEVNRARRRPVANSAYHPRRVGAPSLLSGFAVCIHCGSAIAFERAGHNWPCYLCGRKRRRGWRSCEGRAINARAAEAAILKAVSEQVLTEDYMTALLADLRAQLSDTSALDREEARLTKDLAECERSIANLLDLARTFGARSAGPELIKQEAEQVRLRAELQHLQVKRAAAQVEVTPEALAAVLAAWRGEFAEAKDARDPRALRNFIRRFVAKIELGYNRARVHYTYPLDGFHGNGAATYGGTR